MAFDWHIERTTIDVRKVLNSVETFSDIVQVYEELLFHIFHASESNLFVENLLIAERDGRAPHTIIKVSKQGHRPLRFNNSLSIRAIRNTTRKQYLCVSYGITSAVASRLHQMRRKYIKTYCLLFHPLYSHLLPSCSSDIRSIFTLDEDDKIWPSLDATCIPSSTSSMTTDPEMPELLPPPPTPMPSANDAPDNAIEEAAPPATAAPAGAAAAAVVPLQMAPMDDYLDDLCDCAELMSFAIGYFTLVNRRENLYADLESNRIAGSVIRGLDHLLHEPIRYELAIDEFQRALRRLEEAVVPGSALAERLHLSNLSAQLNLLENDIEVDVETLRARDTPRATDEG